MLFASYNRVLWRPLSWSAFSVLSGSDQVFMLDKVVFECGRKNFAWSPVTVSGKSCHGIDLCCSSIYLVTLLNTLLQLTHYVEQICSVFRHRMDRLSKSSFYMKFPRNPKFQVHSCDQKNWASSAKNKRWQWSQRSRAMVEFIGAWDSLTNQETNQIMKAIWGI